MIKKLFSNNTLLHLIFILLATLTLSNCSNDENDGSSSSNTLLESLGGTEWKYTDGEDVKYYTFKNNLSSPFEEWWGSINRSCYEYYQASSAQSLNVLENTSDSFVIVLDYGHASETYNFRMSGSSLKLTFGANDGGNSSTSYYLFDQSSDVLDQLQICPD